MRRMGSWSGRSVSRVLHGIGLIDPYQVRMKPAHDSKSSAHASTTQYMSHGIKSAGSEVLRAL